MEELLHRGSHIAVLLAVCLVTLSLVPWFIVYYLYWIHKNLICIADNTFDFTEELQQVRVAIESVDVSFQQGSEDDDEEEEEEGKDE